MSDIAADNDIYANEPFMTMPDQMILLSILRKYELLKLKY